MDQLEVIVRESGLEPTKAQVILEKFRGYFEIAAQWEARAKTIVVTDESEKDLMLFARTGRLVLKEKRVAIERTRKELKEQALREGKAIDGLANVLKALIVPIEEHLERQEKFIEIRAAERAAEEARLAAEKAEADRIEADRVAEEERQRKEKERRAEEGRIRAENARLKAEADEREKKAAQDRAEAEARLKTEREAYAKNLAEERLKAETERKTAGEKARKEKEAIEIKACAERRAIEQKAQRERDALEAKAKAERDAQARLLAEKTRRIQELLKQPTTCPKCGHEFSS